MAQLFRIEARVKRVQLVVFTSTEVGAALWVMEITDEGCLHQTLGDHIGWHGP